MTKKNRPEKLLMIGLDGFMMEMIRKFVDEGLMPNMKKFFKEGVSSRALPSIPVDTPTNWTTIATGADPGVHGKTGFYIRHPGKYPDEYVIDDCWLSTFCKAETLWQAAERQGKRTIVINYPVAWPPTSNKGIIVGGSGVFGGPEVKLAGMAQWNSNPNEHEIPISFTPASGWSNLPASAKPILQARIPIGQGGEKMAWTGAGQLSLGHEDQLDIAEQTHYDLALVASQADGYDTLLVCLDRDASKLITKLQPGQWSDWIYAKFGQEKTPGAFRYKLIELTADASKFVLYRTAVANLKEFAHPAELCDPIVENTGPFLKGLDVMYQSTVFGDTETAKQLLEMGVSQYINLTEYLAKSNPWEILITQMQFPDHINHVYIRDIEPSAPDYSQEKADAAWDHYRHGYAEADRFVGEVIDRCADEQTLIVVLSDHAAFPVTQGNCDNLMKVFAQAGLTKYAMDKKGKLQIDWSKTKACPEPTGHNFVWVNLKGRDRHGIVEPGQEYEQVCDEIVEALRSIIDDNTGKHPIALALRRQDAVMLGYGGEQSPDVIFLYEKGYDNDERLPIAGEDPTQFDVFGPPHDGHIGAHSPCLPTIRYSQSSLAAVFFAAGPGIRKGYHKESPIHLKDVAPTVCELLGIEPPGSAEGRIVKEFFES